MIEEPRITCDQCRAEFRPHDKDERGDYTGYAIRWRLYAHNVPRHPHGNSVMGHNGLPFNPLDFCSPQCIAKWMARDDGRIRFVGRHAWSDPIMREKSGPGS